MNDEQSLYGRIRHVQNKIEDIYKEKGIKTEHKNNWQGDEELFFESNTVYVKDKIKKKNGFDPVFGHRKEMYSSSAVIKLAFALQLPEKNFKRIQKTLQKNKVEL